jgi:hypothetical protein
VLASGHWYSSAFFLGIVGIAVGVAATLVSLVLWRIGGPRKRLYYGLISDTALLGSDLPELPETHLEVTLRGQPVREPHVLGVWFQNWSRSDIRSADFDRGKPLVIDVGASILDLLAPERLRRDSPQVTLTIDGTKVEISPALIRARQLIRIDLLTEGPPTLGCSSPIADFTVIETFADNRTPSRSRAGR